MLAWLQAIIAVFPVLGKILDLIIEKPAPVDEENSEKGKVDEEMKKNKENQEKRPSGDFWKDRHP